MNYWEDCTTFSKSIKNDIVIELYDFTVGKDISTRYKFCSFGLLLLSLSEPANVQVALGLSFVPGLDSIIILQWNTYSEHSPDKLVSHHCFAFAEIPCPKIPNTRLVRK